MAEKRKRRRSDKKPRRWRWWWRSSLPLLSVFATCCLPTAASTWIEDAWQWTAGFDSNNAPTRTFSMWDIKDMRAREIKRRLSRTHGYSAEELARMLDKKELIEALAFAEEKVRLAQQAAVQRRMFWKSVVAALVAVTVVLFWPLLQQAFATVHINWVVYTDRKRLEWTRCHELQSAWGLLGITAMTIIDILQAWMTTSILLSWIIRQNHYFFPMPNIPLRPAQFMGGPVSTSGLAHYGINIGPMLIGWMLRYVHGVLEQWTGHALSRAQQRQRRHERAQETPAARAWRRATRKQTKREAQERKDAADAAHCSTRKSAPPLPLAPQFSWMQPIDEDVANGDSTQHDEVDTVEQPGRSSPPPPLPVTTSYAHDVFLREMGHFESDFDQVD